MTESQRLTKISYLKGYFTAQEDTMNFINSLDSADMDTSDVRSAIVHFLMSKCPEIYDG